MDSSDGTSFFLSPRSGSTVLASRTAVISEAAGGIVARQTSDQQEKVFTRWVNFHLKYVHHHYCAIF
jgi:hypothetical protein